MHLTNYSINKRSENFERSEDVSTGHKRSIKYLNDYLRRLDIDVTAVWNRISVSYIDSLSPPEKSKTRTKCIDWDYFFSGNAQKSSPEKIIIFYPCLHDFRLNFKNSKMITSENWSRTSPRGIEFL